MFTGVGIALIIFTLLLSSCILYGLFSIFNFPTVKVILFGIAIIIFSNSLLKDRLMYGIDDLFSIIGFSFCIVGFLKKDRNVGD